LFKNLLLFKKSKLFKNNWYQVEKNRNKNNDKVVPDVGTILKGSSDSKW